MTINESAFCELNRFKWSHGACVIAGVLIATLVRFPLQAVIQSASPFLFYIPLVVVVAIVFGKRCGLFATMLSVLPANFFWMPPEHAFWLDLKEMFQILGFSLAGFAVSWASDEARKHKQLEEHLRATLASMGDAVVTTDCRGRIIYLNAEAQVLTGRNDRELTGRFIGGALDVMAEDGRQSLDGAFQAAITNDQIEHLPRRVILITHTGGQHRVEQKTSRVLDANGKRIGSVILLRRLDSIAKTDPMPTLRNSSE